MNLWKNELLKIQYDRQWKDFAKNTVARKNESRGSQKMAPARRFAVTNISDDAAPSLQLQAIFLDLLTFPNDWAYDREKSLN